MRSASSWPASGNWKIPALEPRVGPFLNATGKKSDGGFQYNGRQAVWVVVLHVDTRDASLRSAVPRVMKAFTQGERVCVHCRHSFQRAPVLFAALCRAIFGISVKTSMDIVHCLRAGTFGGSICAAGTLEAIYAMRCSGPRGCIVGCQWRLRAKAEWRLRAKAVALGRHLRTQ